MQLASLIEDAHAVAELLAALHQASQRHQALLVYASTLLQPSSLAGLSACRLCVSYRVFCGL